MTCDGRIGGSYVPKEPQRTGNVKNAGTTSAASQAAGKNQVSGSAIGEALTHYGKTTAEATTAPEPTMQPTMAPEPEVSGKTNRTLMGKINEMIGRLSGGDADKAKEIRDKVLPEGKDEDYESKTDQLMGAYDVLQQATTAKADAAPTTPTMQPEPEVSGKTNKTLMGKINDMIDRLSGGDADKAKEIRDKVLPEGKDEDYESKTDQLMGAYDVLQQATTAKTETAPTTPTMPPTPDAAK